MQTRAAAIELLNALLGKAKQIRVMPVRIVGMALEMRTQRFDFGAGVLA
jgi:hypothetical protein